MKDYSTIPNTSGSFPDVVSQNATGPGETDGTPYIKQVIDDLWGARQALMDYAGLTPNGSQETSSNSQFLQAIGFIIARALLVTFTKNMRHMNSNKKGYDNLQDITYGLGYWIAVGIMTGGDEIQVSQGGGAWTTIANPTAQSYYGVHANSTHAVAVGTNGALIYSTTPGSSWVDNSSGISTGGATLLSVWFGNGVWTAVDSNGFAYTATDPTGTWTQRATPASANNYQLDSVRYIDDLSLWIAVGKKQTSPAFSGIITATDPTGTWTERTNPISGAAHFTDITFDGNVAVISGGSETSHQDLCTSTNGTTWTDRSGNLPDNDYVASCEAEPINNVIVISLGDEMYTSSNGGSSWKPIDSDGYFTYVSGYFDQTPSGNRFIFVGNDDILRSLMV